MKIVSPFIGRTLQYERKFNERMLGKKRTSSRLWPTCENEFFGIVGFIFEGINSTVQLLLCEVMPIS